MNQLDTKRHDALFNRHEFALPIHVIGVGGVGSHVAYLLAKLGCGTHPQNSIHLYDGDTVESHNPPNQAFLPVDVGKQKAVALSLHYTEISAGNISHPHSQYVKGHIPLSGIVFLCLDSMQARKDICESSIWRNKEVVLLIETRMDVDNIVVFAVDPNNEEHIALWNEYWFSDEDAVNIAGCGGHLSIITTVVHTAVKAVEHFLSFVKKNNLSEVPNRLRRTISTGEEKRDFW